MRLYGDGLMVTKTLLSPSQGQIRTGIKATSMPIAAKEVVICNPLGLHARPAMQFVDLANQFSAAVAVNKRGDSPCEVDGKSVMQLITLEAAVVTRL